MKNFMQTMQAMVLGASVLAASFAVAQSEISFKSTELTKGFYVLEGVGGFAGGNILLTVGDEGAVMIDNGIDGLLPALTTALQKITPQPIRYLINTHGHFDHAGNNAQFGSKKTQIVAHQNMRKFMFEQGIPGMKGITPVPAAALPVITYSDQMAFYVNGNLMQLVNVASAHTNGDTVIHIPNENIIHAGDVLFNGMFPFIDLSLGGSIDGYIAAQKRIYALANGTTKIIPGHGPIATREDLKKSITMLEYGREQVQQLINKGLTEDQVVAKNPLAKYEKLSWAFITTEKMTRTLYQGLTGKVVVSEPEHKH